MYNHLPKKFNSFLSLLTILALTLTMSFLPFKVQKAGAADFTQAFLKLDRIKASTTTSGTVCAKPATTATEGKVKVAFPTGFTVNATAGNWTTTTTSLPASATAWTGIGSSATGVSSQTVTWTSGDLTPGTLYCFNFSGTTTLTTSTAGNSKSGTISTTESNDTAIDSTTYAVAIVTDDQIDVSATVGPIFTLAFGTDTQALGTLSTSAVTSGSGATITIGTNAQSGWYTWGLGGNDYDTGYASLLSATTSERIGRVNGSATINATPEDLADSGDYGYILDVDITTDSGTGDGTVTVAAEYNGSDTNSGGTIGSTYQQLASSTGTTDGDVLTLIPRARVSAIQAAATDYINTLTIFGTGNF